jgi:hypothetical protein
VHGREGREGEEGGGGEREGGEAKGKGEMEKSERKKKRDRIAFFPFSKKAPHRVTRLRPEPRLLKKKNREIYKIKT